MSSEAISKAEFFRNYLRELRSDNAAIFIGAGMSMAAGYVDWRGLLKDVAQDLGLDATEEPDLVRLAQYYCNKSGSKAALTQIILDHFATVKTPTENHRVLAALPIQTYWTTNYDTLVERALEAEGRVADVKHTVDHLAVTRRDRTVVVYKMHGDASYPADAVINRDDYERYSTKMEPYVVALRGDLVERTFLFLGFSFTDPNIDYILSRVRVQHDGRQRRHYCVLKAATREPGEKTAHYERRKLQQEYFIADLKRFHIATVLVDSYGGITDVLKELARKFRSSSVLISGAAVEFSPWAQSKAEELLGEVAQGLVARGNRLITGFGLGVGGAALAGALAALHSQNKELTDRAVLLRPFPRTSGSKAKSAASQYRRSLIKDAGIAVFVFGNKADRAGAIVPSDGMREEFEQCVSSGVFPIPIGASGYMAEQLWKQVVADVPRYYPGIPEREIRSALTTLGDKSASIGQLVTAVEEIIAKLQQN